MLQEVIERLNTAQRAELAKHGITYNRLWSWRTGQRLPTELQTVYLAEATGADWAELQREVTVLRAPEDERAKIAQVIGWGVGNRSIDHTLVDQSEVSAMRQGSNAS